MKSRLARTILSVVLFPTEYLMDKPGLLQKLYLYLVLTPIVFLSLKLLKRELK